MMLSIILAAVCFALNACGIICWKNNHDFVSDNGYYIILSFVFIVQSVIGVGFLYYSCPYPVKFALNFIDSMPIYENSKVVVLIAFFMLSSVFFYLASASYASMHRRLFLR